LSAEDRKKEYVLEAGTVWCDFDREINPFDLKPIPSIVIETSPKRYHCYWLVDEPLTVQNLEYWNRRIAYGFSGGDVSGWDANQLLRLPHGLNRKSEPHWSVRVLRMESTTVALGEFSHLPDPAELLAGDAIPDDPTPTEALPLEWIYEHYKDVLTVKLKQMIERKQGDRSRALWYIYNECSRLGVT